MFRIGVKCRGLRVDHDRVTGIPSFNIPWVYTVGMQHGDDILRLVTGAHALTRVASLETRNEAPAAQWRTITLLRDHGPQRIGDLAALSRVTQPGMTRLVAQMADAGLLERGADDNDSRATVVSVEQAADQSGQQIVSLLLAGSDATKVASAAGEARLIQLGAGR